MNDSLAPAPAPAPALKLQPKTQPTPTQVPAPASPEAAAPSLSNCDLAQQLLDSYHDDGVQCQRGRDLPSPREVGLIIDSVRELLLPGSTGLSHPTGKMLHSHVEGMVATLRVKLMQQLYRGLLHRCPRPDPHCAECEQRAGEIAARFLDGLPALRRRVLLDVRAAFDGDPAATGMDEVVFSYPGLRAVTVYRIANLLWRLEAPVVPRMMTEQAHADTGIDIHPGARIGDSFFIDHGTGVVIGETSIIGNRVRIYQGVTLGALSLPSGVALQVRAGQRVKRHPTIEDDVIIYANATILGGSTVIGRGAIIGGNTWVTESVAAGARVTNPCR